MEFKFNMEQIPSIIYMEFDSEDGKSFVVFENGVLLENINGISLVHNESEYGLDLNRGIGFQNEKGD
jgi:hypothetical protein